VTRRISITNERGQAMAELAIVMPILTVLLLGIVQFGIAFNHYLTLTDAVRAGGRQATVSRFLDSSARAPAITQRVKDAAGGLDSTKVAVTVTAPDGSAASWAPGSDVKVTGSYPYSIDVFGLPFVKGSLSTSATERVE
jgi:Flp pilus assembly protein TadG